MEETRRQSEIVSQPLFGERGSWEGDASGDDGDGVCVSDHFSLQETRNGDISLLLCTSVSSQMN